jgi:hypothetical protein
LQRVLEDVDTRDKRGHDASCVAPLAMRQRRLCRYADWSEVIDFNEGVC